MIKTLLALALVSFLSSAQAIQPIEGTIWGSTFLSGDVNGDTYADLVEVYNTIPGPARMRIWIGGPTGFGSSPTYLYPDFTWYNGTFLMGDVNGDGMQDLVQVFTTGDQIGYWLWLATPTGYYIWPQHGNYAMGQLRDGRVMLGDINGDGRADLIQLFTNNAGNAAYIVWLSVPGMGFVTPIFTPDMGSPLP